MEREASIMVCDWRESARLGQGEFGSRNGGWAYDAYPELETLDAGRCIKIAEIEGPAVITNPYHPALPEGWQALRGRKEGNLRPRRRPGDLLR